MGRYDERRASAVAIIDEAIPLVERQLELVRRRGEKLDEFARELEEKLAHLRAERRKRS